MEVLDTTVFAVELYIGEEVVAIFFLPFLVGPMGSWVVIKEGGRQIFFKSYKWGVVIKVPPPAKSPKNR